MIKRKRSVFCSTCSFRMSGVRHRPSMLRTVPYYSQFPSINNTEQRQCSVTDVCFVFPSPSWDTEVSLSEISHKDFQFAWFQVSATVRIIPTLLCHITHCQIVWPCRRWGKVLVHFLGVKQSKNCFPTDASVKTHRPHLQECSRYCFNLKDGINRLSRNVCEKLPFYAA